MNPVRALASLAISFARNGFTQNLRLANNCLYLPLEMKLYPLFLFIYKAYRIVAQRLRLNRDIGAMRNWTDALTHAHRDNQSGVSLGDLLIDDNQINSIQLAARGNKQIIIADIDQDGDWYSHFGELRGVPSISEDQFLQRKRYRLQVVLQNNEIGIKKLYGRDKISFVNEFKILDRLTKAGCNVPSILDVDVDELALTVRLVKGNVLREELARSGAKLRDRDVERDQNFLKLDPDARRRKRIEEGKRVLHRVIDKNFIEKAFDELSKIHSARIVWRDVKYGNVIIGKESSAPYLIDFDWADYCPGLSKAIFNRLRDSDIDQFNEHFGTHNLTYEKLATQLKKMDVYAPVYFGAGLRAGPIWRVDSGFGRWHYILKKNYPPIVGKRILDLGANNGHNAMQLLREGAEEVVGVELSKEFVDQSNIVKAGYEWADNRKYKYELIHASMAEIPQLGLGNFDIVQALCSLYYLSEDEMERVAKFVGTISECFVLQCNLQRNIGREDARTYTKAGIEFTLALLERSGFTVTEVVAPWRYSRPLVIGRKPRDRTFRNAGSERVGHL